MNMSKNIKFFLTFVLVFISLLFVTPMFSWSRGCVGGGPDLGCVIKTTFQSYFPMHKTIVCTIWNNPGCATGTFLPGWYDEFINPVNIFILVLLFFISFKVSKKIINTTKV